MEKKLKALIIDDEKDICYLLGGMLEFKNMDAKYVYSIGEARKVLNTDKPAVVFLDNHLPDGSGMLFIEEIKHKYPDIKIVMISAYDTTIDKRKAAVEGVNQFIGKPFTKDMIFETLEKIL